jgi:DNA-binding YbaB/EbfC family protein
MGFDLQQMQSLLGQAKKQYEELREKMARTSVEASAGAGMVWVRMSGDKQVQEIRLDAEIAKSDPEMLADLVKAAVNEASRRVDELLRQELGSAMGGFGAGLPGLF